ncbi:type VI secretion-associated protein, ImpA family [Bordetella hinzii CA90 BAL1384]|nr:type VI secretion-associated protein, ImpA family [Bordetella hinzii CA90 BAL1384]
MAWRVAAGRARLGAAMIDPLLQDLPGERAGRPLRYDAVTARIGALRREDDASLPQGEWQHPLRRADWKEVAALCEQALCEQGKDFQIAAWLCEAWTQMHGLAGLGRGAGLLAGLVQRFWNDAWPRIEDGELEPRLAPFVWLVAHLPLVIVARMPLLASRDEAWLTVDALRRLAKPSGPDAPQETAHDMSQAVALAAADPGRGDKLRVELAQALEAWEGLGRLLDARLGPAAPSLEPLREAGRGVQAALAMLWPAATAPDEAVPDGAVPDGAVPESAPAVPTAPLTPYPADRAQAYAQLRLIAAYLAEIEPHSPTPYLLRQAAAWGELPLDALLRTVVKEEGGLARFLALLEVS